MIWYDTYSKKLLEASGNLSFVNSHGNSVKKILANYKYILDITPIFESPLEEFIDMALGENKFEPVIIMVRGIYNEKGDDFEVNELASDRLFIGINNQKYALFLKLKLL